MRAWGGGKGGARCHGKAGLQVSAPAPEHSLLAPELFRTRNSPLAPDLILAPDLFHKRTCFLRSRPILQQKLLFCICIYHCLYLYLQVFKSAPAELSFCTRPFLHQSSLAPDSPKPTFGSSMILKSFTMANPQIACATILCTRCRQGFSSQYQSIYLELAV